MENVSSFPHLNEPAPAFKANTTHGERTLDDYKGKWLILFSHPAYFTPVCTTEFIAFAKAADKFKGMNCELLGLSIDSIYSHLAWMQSIKNSFGVEIPFPIIDDIKMDVARALRHDPSGRGRHAGGARHLLHRPRRQAARHGVLPHEQWPVHRRVRAPVDCHANQRCPQDCNP